MVAAVNGVVDDMLAAAARIEREKLGKALTPDEARTVRAVGFLRQIAPYLFESSSEAPPDRKDQARFPAPWVTEGDMEAVNETVNEVEQPVGETTGASAQGDGDSGAEQKEAAGEDSGD